MRISKKSVLTWLFSISLLLAQSYSFNYYDKSKEDYAKPSLSAKMISI
jgi:hypothetical protein